MLSWYCRVMLADPGHPTTPHHHQPSTLCAGCCMHCCTPQTVLPAHEVAQGPCTACCSSTLAVPQLGTSKAGSCLDHSTQTGSGNQDASNPATLSY